MDPNHNDSTVTELVAQKFRISESVVAIFEGYQIDDNKHQDRLLAVVSSYNSSALFIFSIAQYPPKCISDLTIVNVYPIDETFGVNTDSATVSSISGEKLTIISQNEPTVFYHQACPDTVASREYFITKLKQLTVDFKNISSQAGSSNGTLDFKWVDSYKRTETGNDRPLSINSMIKEELERRRSEYIVYKPLIIYTATWNVNGQTAEDIELPEWLSTTEDPPDIYAIAFQEVEFTVVKIVMKETKIDRTWVEKVISGLHSGAVYEEIESVRLVGTMLSVFVKSSLRNQISDCLIKSVPTGALNYGNKGGVGISFQLNESLLCFVNAHLTADLQKVAGRNRDHDEIMRKMFFENTSRLRSIHDHHHIFWVGDLNYRLDEISRELIDENGKDYMQLYAFDQLYKEKFKKRIFFEYKEGKISFAPTYKYDPGTDEWDSNRTPAWCDRILWKGPRIDLLKYDSVMQLRKSDHKPVFAVFNVGIETKDEFKLKQIHQEIFKNYNKFQKENKKKIIVEQTDIDFGLIRFNEKYSRELLIAYNGDHPVQFKLVAKDDNERNIWKDIIQISHKSGELDPDSSLSIWIEIFVDAKAASCILKNLNDAKAGKKTLLDTLVLQVENDKDVSIYLFGEYKSSCFGVSLETLMNLDKPIKEYKINELISLEENKKRLNLADDQNLKIPREISQLVDYLSKIDMQSTMLFDIMDGAHNKHQNILEIRDWLDSWSTEAFPVDSINAPGLCVEVLLLLLEALPEPVVPLSVQDCYVCADNYEKYRKLICTELKPLHRRLFIYICKFLNELRKENSNVRLDEMANAFGKVLIRPTHSPMVTTPGANEAKASYIDDERDQRPKLMMTLMMSKIQDMEEAEPEYNKYVALYVLLPPSP
ncbi:inositol polyphosphate 5-phosphatase OCRL-like [Uranotaenia lowii]|uniref:inositol polyphosphate 5-phosphatase OCRL-like n=1 Tax=Uranotaenia lowii TaxID=190385 RepID=UPI00247A2F6F|nr:inositol polyphosphate 5-phosphatase OCRL-like [Uranotaenia lowii]